MKFKFLFILTFILILLSSFTNATDFTIDNTLWLLSNSSLSENYGISGKIGNYTYFNGAAYILNSESVLDDAGGSLELYFSTTDTSSTMYVYSSSAGSNSRHYIFSNTGTISFAVCDQGSISSGVSISSGQIYKLNLEWDGSNYEIFVDDVSKGTGTYTCGTSFSSYIGYGAFNQDGTSISTYFTGNIYNTTITDSSSDITYYNNMNSFSDISQTTDSNIQVGGVISNTSSYYTDGTSTYIDVPLAIINDAQNTIHFWINPKTTFNDGVTQYLYDAGTNEYSLFKSTSNNLQGYCGGTAFTPVASEPNWWTDGNLHMIDVICDSSANTWEFYIDGVLNNSGSATHSTGSEVGIKFGARDITPDKYIEANYQGMAYFEDDISSSLAELFALGPNYNPYIPVPTPSNDSVESTAVVKQTGTVTLLGLNPQIIISSDFYIPNNDTALYGAYSFNVLATNTNQVYCTIDINGTIIANKTRNNVAGVEGNMFPISGIIHLDKGNYTQSLICQRTSGAGQITISESVGIGHFLIDELGYQIPHNDSTFNQNVNSGSSYTEIANFNITIGNNSGGEQYHNLIIEGGLEYTNNLGSDEIMGGYLSINNSFNCSFYPRYVESGNTGSVSMDCAMENVTANSTYNIKLHMNGTNANYVGNIIAKSFYISDEEISGGVGALTGLNFTGSTDTMLFNLSGGNINHDLTNVFEKMSLSILTTNNTEVNVWIKLINGTTKTTKNFSRNFEAGKIGVLIGHDSFEDVPIDNYEIQVWVNCGGADLCEIVGGAGIGYITDVTTTLINSFTITSYNQWNGTKILNFNATNGATYTTTTGEIEFISNEFKEDITISSNGYIDKTYYNHSTNTSLNTTIYQSFVTINSTEINTNNLIYNWTLHTNKGNFTTTNGTINIYPNLGTYNWNWTNLQSYFNVTNIQFIIDEVRETLTISNFFARNITFKDNLSLTSIQPSCIQDGYTYSTYDYLMHKSTSTITCTLFGFDSLSLINNTFPDNSQYEMQPVGLQLTFSELTSGIVQAGDTYIAEFNSTNITIPQANITEGYVKITFNPETGDKYQQIFSYYNDLNTTIKEDILVQTVDLQQEIKVTGNTQALINARVCAKYPLNETYYTTYCDFTDSVGQTIIQVNDQNTYLFCVQAEGFEPECELHHIPATNQDTITINLVGQEERSGTNYIATTCRGIYTTDESCTLNVITYKPYYSICINLTKYTATTSSSSETCSYNSISETFLYNLYQNYTAYNLSIYLNGDLENIIYHRNSTDEATNQINFNSGNNTGQTILEKVEDNVELYIMLHLIMVGIGVLSGYIMDKYFNGMGVYGAGLWFLFLGIAQLYLFYIPAIVICVHFIMNKVIPLYKN